jgi:hypothetical protein
MQKEPKEKKGIGKFLQGLGKVGGNLLDIAGDVTKIPGLKKLGDLINQSDELTPEEKEEALKLIEMELADRQNARNMQIEALGQSDNFSKRYLYYLSSFIVVSATLFGVLLFFIDVPEENKRLVEMFADIYLFAGAMAVINFFFGSSIGSKEKDLKRQ